MRRATIFVTLAALAVAAAITAVVLQRERNQVDEEGLTPLMGAVLDYDNDAIVALVDEGADPGATGTMAYSNASARTLFAEQGERDPAAVRKLLMCDPELLRNDEYWKIVLKRFVMHHVPDWNAEHCLPSSEADIERLMKRLAGFLRDPRVVDALSQP
jgi:hypothetical protein